MGLIEAFLKSDHHAIKLLMRDHREVDALFLEYEKADNVTHKMSLVSRICQSLTVHADIEERILYPAARAVLGQNDQDLLDEAYVEHATLKGLIIRLDGLRHSDPLFKGYVSVLKEYVQHHVKEEERDFFPKLEKAGLNLEQLGLRMMDLKERSMALLKSEPQQTGVVNAPALPALPLEERSQQVMRES